MISRINEPTYQILDFDIFVSNYIELPRLVAPWLSDINWFIETKKFIESTSHVKQKFFVINICVSHFSFYIPVFSDYKSKHWSVLSSFYTPDFDLLHSNNFVKKNYWKYLITALNDFYPQWNSLTIYPLRSQIDISNFSIENRCGVHRYVYSKNYFTIIGSLKQYWDSRPTILKNTIKQKHKKISTVSSNISIYTKITDELICSYWNIYDKSWKPPEPNNFFINWFLNYCSDKNFLRLGLLYINQVPVAFHFWIVIKKECYIFKLAQDKDYDEFSPGTLLMSEMLAHVVDIDHVTKIDFLNGADSYKNLWMEESSYVYAIKFYNLKSLIGFLLFCKSFVIKFKKKFLTLIPYVSSNAD